MKNPLLDKDFLLKLDAIKKKKVFARIISLTKDEYPIEQIEGKVTQGSINVDGSSAVRRSCSLTLVAADLKIHNFYWGLKTKFKLEVGIENTIDPTYPEIIWFPQGMYVINSFNVSQSMTNYSISISGRDKMSLVNGELGGTIVASSHDFGTIDITDEEGNVTREDLLLKDIITYALNEFCGEPLHNIVINDLDESGIELLEYRGDNPLFILREVDSDIVVASYNKIYQNVILENPTSLEPYQKWHIDDSDTKYSFTELMEKSEELKFYFDELNSDFAGAAAHEPTMVWGDSKEKKYYVAKIEYGMTPGYRETGLTYAGDLILNAGDNVATLLERIKTMLGDFEYFYDLDGRFIFQRQRTYVNRSWNNLVESNGDVFADSVATTSAITYSFENSALIQSFSNTPVLANIKNDYAVWGTRKSVTGKELPVHVRYAIDEKPEYYKNFSGEIFITKEFDISLLENNFYNLVDWRELIYQMALDYRKNSKTIDNFEVQLAENNKLSNGHEGYYCDGKTGYEQYYTDLEGFWRGLYNTNPEPEYELIQMSKIKETFDNKNLYVKEFRPADSELDRNKKINEFYKIIDGELVNYIDTVNFSNMKVFVKLNSEEEKYIHPLDTLDISKKSLYIKNIEDKYIELKEYKFIVDGREEADKIKYQIYIKDGNKFLKVWDFFNVEKYYGQEIVIYPNSGEFFYIENAPDCGRHIYQDVYNKEKKDYESTEITNVDDLINNKLLAYYLSGEEKIYIADMPIYIRRQRDIENKEWYVLTDPIASNSDYKLFVDEFLSNEKVDGKI